MTDQPRSEWARLADLFDGALQLPPDAREAYLAQHAKDPATAQEVRELLANSADDAFLQSPLARAAPTAVPGFRIVRELGSGGMGTVHVAEQESPHRLVALKLLRPFAIGPAAARRFGAEAEILARLQHPNIAQVFAAGVFATSGGEVPWFALELIDGAEPITHHATRRRLPLDDRLRLFVTVCAGVQHAHDRGVVHRDLKPANVLVGSDGIAKIIDFGVASAAGGEHPLPTQHTAAGELLGTLGYMSPEQCEGRPTAQDGRSDVYSLGVVLYELVTGRLPYAVGGLSLPSALRTIVENPPARAPDLPADLEAVLLTALAKDPHRRYRTPTALAADVERFLAGEAVVARRPSWSYQLRVLARRHRGAVLAGALVLVTMTSAAAVSTWFAFAARERAVEADEQRDAAEQTLAILTGALRAANPFLAPRQVTVGELLEDAARRLAAGEVRSAAVRLRLHTALGSAFRGIGQPKRGREHLEQALEMLAEVAPHRLADRLEIGDLLAAACSDGGDQAAAIAAMEQVLAAAERSPEPSRVILVGYLARLGGYQTKAGLSDAAAATLARALELGRTTTSHPVHLAEACANLGTLLWRRGQLEPAAEHWQRALDLFSTSLDPDHPLAAQTRSNYGLYLQDRQRYAEAEAMFTGARDTLARLRGPESADVANGELKLAFLYQAMQQFERAEAAFTRAVLLREKLFGKDALEVDDAREGLAYLQLHRGRWAEARDLLLQILKARQVRQPADHPDVAATRLLLGRAWLGLDDAATAEPHLLAAVEVRRRSFGAGNLRTATAESAYGECLFRLGRTADAEPLLRQALQVLTDTLGMEHAETKTAAGRLRAFEQAVGKPR